MNAAIGLSGPSPRYSSKAAASGAARTRGRSGNAGTAGKDFLTAWSWCGLDPWTDRDLVFVVATYSRGEVGWVCRRAGLPRPAFRTPLRPYEPGFATAMAHPYSLRWMTLDELAHRSDRWLDEQQLTVLRPLQGQRNRDAAGRGATTL